ncbi:MAG TPA: hypothetical protein VGC41_21205, partial [Kofleriaceae bacterium]
MRRGVLVFRVYALTAAIAIAVILAMIYAPRFVGTPKYLEPQAALVQNMVDRYSTRPPADLAERMERLSHRLKGGLSLYDPNGNLIRTTVDPPLAKPTASEIADLGDNDKWTLSYRRIVVHSDAGDMFGVYVPASS